MTLAVAAPCFYCRISQSSCSSIFLICVYPLKLVTLYAFDEFFSREVLWPASALSRVELKPQHSGVTLLTCLRVVAFGKF